MVKKLILALVFVCFTCVTVSAAPHDPPEKEARQLLSNLKDLRYKLDSGLTFGKYQEALVNLDAKLSRWRDEYPSSSVVFDLGGIMLAHNDIKRYWENAMDNPIMDESIYNSDKNMYKGIDKYVSKAEGGVTYYSMIKAITDVYLKQYEKDTEKTMDIFYKQQTKKNKNGKKK